jgi:hypothetical protein
MFQVSLAASLVLLSADADCHRSQEIKRRTLKEIRTIYLTFTNILFTTGGGGNFHNTFILVELVPCFLGLIPTKGELHAPLILVCDISIMYR